MFSHKTKENLSITKWTTAKILCYTEIYNENKTISEMSFLTLWLPFVDHGRDINIHSRLWKVTRQIQTMLGTPDNVNFALARKIIPDLESDIIVVNI